MLSCKGKLNARGVIWCKARVNYASLNAHHETVFKIRHSKAARRLECNHKRKAKHIVDWEEGQEGPFWLFLFYIGDTRFKSVYKTPVNMRRIVKHTLVGVLLDYHNGKNDLIDKMNACFQRKFQCWGETWEG